MLRTTLGAIECVRNGITTIQDFLNLAPYDPELLDAVIEAYGNVGVRVVLGVTVRVESQLDTILWADEMKDLLKAAGWYERALVKDKFFAPFALGELYSTPGGLPPDKEKAIACFRVALAV